MSPTIWDRAGRTPATRRSSPRSMKASALHDRASAPVFGILEIEAAPGLPCPPVITLIRQTACLFQHPRHMHQVPRHDRGVALREVVVEACAVVAIARAGAGFTHPAAIGLRGDRVA